MKNLNHATATANPVRSNTGQLALLNLRWGLFVLGLAVNIWAFWVMGAGIAKEGLRFGFTKPTVPSNEILNWVYAVFPFNWLPKDAILVYPIKKVIFCSCNFAYILVVLLLFFKKRRVLTLLTAALILINVALILSPAVGNLH